MRKHSRFAVVLIAVIVMFSLLSGCDRQQQDEHNIPNISPEENGISQSSQAPEETEPLPAPPAEPPRKRTVLYFSDMQADPDIGDYSGLGDLMSKAFTSREMPDLVVIGGDSVNDGGDEAEWRLFHNATGEWFAGVTTASAAGNHDSYALLVEQFDYPREAPAGAGQGFFYTLSVDSVYFVILDSNIMGAANESDIQWLQAALDNETARQSDWIIVVMHHPMWPVTNNPKDEERAATMREFFLPLLEEFGVALILCGHQHVYSRTFPMSGDAAAENGRGIVQVMVASGDKPTYTPGERDYITALASAPNFVVLSADSESLVITTFDEEGSIIDEAIMRSSDRKGIGSRE